MKETYQLFSQFWISEIQTTDEWTVVIKVVKSLLRFFQQKSDFWDYTKYSKQTTPCSLQRVWNLQLCVTAITFFSLSFLLFFSSRVQEALITGGSRIVNVDEIATVFLSNKIFQRKQSSWFWILTNGTHDWLRLCGFSNYAKIRVSSWNILKITLHRVTTIWLIFSSENLHALDNNTLEQRIPRHIVLIWNLQLCVTAITFFLFSVNFFSFTRTGRLNHRFAQWK